MSVGVGLAARTVNPPARVALPPPGAGFVTVTFRAPSDALDPITRVAVRDVALTTDTSLTVMLEPKETVVRPETKPEPVNVTGTVA